jgi:site-specific DNA-cytosine methylase
MLESTPKTATPYDGNIQLTGTITTSGGPSDLHPNGSQTFNCHQLAVLAGFSPYYKWDTAAPKTRLRKMIGNAVCMMLSKAVVESVVKSVKKRDLEIMEFNSEVIEIDDDLPVVVLDD